MTLMEFNQGKSVTKAASWTKVNPSMNHRPTPWDSRHQSDLHIQGKALNVLYELNRLQVRRSWQKLYLLETVFINCKSINRISVNWRKTVSSQLFKISCEDAELELKLGKTFQWFTKILHSSACAAQGLSVSGKMITWQRDCILTKACGGLGTWDKIL